MRPTFSLLFYPKKPKEYVQGEVYIYGRITVNGEIKEFSSGRKWEPDRWNSEAGKPAGNKEEAKALVTYLDTLKNKLYESLNRLVDSNSVVSAETLKNKFIGKGEKPLSLVRIFQDHNDRIKILVGEEYATGTHERYETTLRHTIEFMKWKYKVSDYDIRSIDHSFITEFDFYLRSERKCGNNTTIKYLKNFKKIILLCLDNEWILKNPFAKYKPKLREVKRVFLTMEEIRLIMTKVFKSKRLRQVAQVFIFCCFTGLAYIDVKQLTSEHIVIGIDGQKWISLNRQKTDSHSSIPLLPVAQAILDEYANDPACLAKGVLLPVMSNQKMNSYLKEIADFCGILKELTFHIARHTFATTIALAHGISMEALMRMLGHKDIKMTQHYGKITDTKVSEEMQMLRNRLILSERNNETQTGT